MFFHPMILASVAVSTEGAILDAASWRKSWNRRSLILALLQIRSKNWVMESGLLKSLNTRPEELGDRELNIVTALIDTRYRNIFKN